MLQAHRWGYHCGYGCPVSLVASQPAKLVPLGHSGHADSASGQNGHANGGMVQGKHLLRHKPDPHNPTEGTLTSTLSRLRTKACQPAHRHAL